VNDFRDEVQLAGGLPALGGVERLQDRVRDELRAAIIDGRLVPGKLYSVQTLADQFGVSRSPVREALIDLGQNGMVRFERNRGVRVLETSIHDLEEIFTLRLLLEVPATYRATRQMTPEAIALLQQELEAMRTAADAGDERAMMRHDARWHGALLEMSGNRRLVEYVDRLRDVVLTKGASTVGRSRTLHDICEEHEAIIERVVARDAKAAASQMKRHLINTGCLLLKQEGGRDDEGALNWGDLVPF
jgi:DNA-binding GntR family transcriptional regulator